jgi:hypothetical protein
MAGIVRRAAVGSAAMALALAIPALQARAGPGTAAPHAAVRLEVKRLRHGASIAVFNLRARSVEVRLKGGTDADGSLLPWRPLKLVKGVWRGTVPAPALRGVYPILLREGHTAHARSLRAFVRILARGSRARPAFDDAADVVAWWVRTFPRAKLVAVRQWPRPAFDKRDARLHRLYVVAYSLPGLPRARDRLGMFVSTFRDGYDTRWRFLEATVVP